jgi:hypothetical protein
MPQMQTQMGTMLLVMMRVRSEVMCVDLVVVFEMQQLTSCRAHHVDEVAERRMCAVQRYICSWTAGASSANSRDVAGWGASGAQQRRPLMQPC